MNSSQESLTELRPTTGAPAVPRTSGLLFWNIALTLTTGTLICFWVWRQTDAFEEFAAILGLSGVLSWVGTFFKIIPESRTEALRTTIYEGVLVKLRTFVFLFLFLAAIVVATLFSASVEVATFQQSVERAVLVYPLENAEGGAERGRSARINDEDFETLKPGGKVRTVVWLPRITGSRHVVKVSGYPDKVVTLHGWQREELVVPASFRREVVLLRPSAALINLAQSDPSTPRTLIVRTTNFPTPLRIPFDGHAVWLGCDANVQVPEFLQTLWDARNPSAVARQFWSFPLAFTNSYELTPGQSLQIEIEPRLGTLTNSVRPMAAHSDFLPQVIDLNFAESQ